MSEKKYKIVINSDFESCNPNLLEDYWDFSDFEKRKYTYSVASIGDKYNIGKHEVGMEIKSHGYIETKALMNCGVCYISVKAYSRNEYLSIKKGINPQFACESCLTENVKGASEYLINRFNELVPKEIISKKERPTQELSYLESVLIYTLLTQSSFNEKGYITEFSWQKFKELEAVGLEDTLCRLFDKGFISINELFLDDEELDDVVESINLISNEYMQYLDFEFKNQLIEISSIDFSNSIHINFPDKFDNMDLWVEEIYHEIISSKLTLQDCKEIETYVMTKRLMEVYELLDYACNHWNVPVVKSSALEFDMLRMVSIFNLNDCFAIIFYQAKETSALLNKMRSDDINQYRFTKMHVLRIRISSYIDHLEKKNEKPKYSRPLPMEWITSEVELFVSMNIIKGYQKWEKFTPSEIVEKWISNCDYISDS